MQSIAVEMFEEYANGNKQAIPALFKAVVFNTVARLGGENNYEKIFNIYQNPVSSEEKIIALRALGRFEDKELFRKDIVLSARWYSFESRFLHPNARH
ncbi:Aminopeptidase 2 mitochondrial [Fusarium falciforme]|nr:Aminopeptidase 2 mitochondrial [Fusarium falciforme]